MKKYLLIIMLIAAGYSVAFTQNKITTNVRTGQDVNEVLSDSRFLFPEFQNAIVVTKQGTGKAMMNYNMLTGDMMFIDQNGDTLVLLNPAEIYAIRFGKQEFIYSSKKYVEILATAGTVSLAISRRIKPVIEKQYGAYGMATNTASIDNVNALTDNANSVRLTINKEITYTVVQVFYLQSGKSLKQATEKNFQKAFEKNKEVINTFIKEHGLDLKKEEDIIRLFNFCTQ
jgi:hypothetical protein